MSKNDNNSVNSCLLCGVGGQGTVLASKLIAYAAMKRGDEVRTSETIGMAQRGGCVVSHVRAGKNINSPMIPRGAAQVLIAFEPAEAVRCLSYLAPDGAAVVNRRAIMPITVNFGGVGYDENEMLDYLKANVPNLTIVDGDAVCRAVGSKKVLNIALLAVAAATGRLSLTPDELRDTIRARVNPKFVDVNLKAVDLAIEMYGKKSD